MTADELWRSLPGADADSVHLADFPTGLESLVDAELIDRWDRLLRVRDAVNSELETLRQNKVVGTSLEAVVHLTANGELATLLERYQEELPTLFITSAVTLTKGTPPEADNDTLFQYQDPEGSARIEVGRPNAAKCPRCWRWVCPETADGRDSENTEVCTRCADALADAVSPVA